MKPGVGVLLYIIPTSEILTSLDDLTLALIQGERRRFVMSVLIRPFAENTAKIQRGRPFELRFAPFEGEEDADRRRPSDAQSETDRIGCN